jgi:hypothetical protein
MKSNPDYLKTVKRAMADAYGSATTYNLHEAGYLLSDGSWLRMDHDGSRGEDHRTVAGYVKGKPLKEAYEGSRWPAVVQWMKVTKSIRWMPETASFDVYTKPTEDQLRSVREAFDWFPDVTVECTRGKKHSERTYDRRERAECISDLREFWGAARGYESNLVTRRHGPGKKWLEEEYLLWVDGTPYELQGGEYHEYKARDLVAKYRPLWSREAENSDALSAVLGHGGFRIAADLHFEVGPGYGPRMLEVAQDYIVRQLSRPDSDPAACRDMRVWYEERPRHGENPRYVNATLSEFLEIDPRRASKHFRVMGE